MALTAGTLWALEISNSFDFIHTFLGDQPTSHPSRSLWARKESSAESTRSETWIEMKRTSEAPTICTVGSTMPIAEAGEVQENRSPQKWLRSSRGHTWFCSHRHLGCVCDSLGTRQLEASFLSFIASSCCAL